MTASHTSGQPGVDDAVVSAPPAGGPLRARLVGLAGTPDDSYQVATDLIVIAQLSATLIGAVAHASVTSRHEGGYATVAAGSDLAADLDQAQYDDGAGPCLDALTTGRPVAVPHIAGVAHWPEFRTAATASGLRSSLSIPLFAGSGITIASLNLYGSDRNAMRALARAVRRAYEPDGGDPPATETLDPATQDPAAHDPGGQDLVAGLIGARRLRRRIQHAVEIVRFTGATNSERAYLTLRMQAAVDGLLLADVAARTIAGYRPGYV
jgi:hypothetical protein